MKGKSLDGFRERGATLRAKITRGTTEAAAEFAGSGVFFGGLSILFFGQSLTKESGNRMKHAAEEQGVHHHLADDEKKDNHEKDREQKAKSTETEHGVPLQEWAVDRKKHFGERCGLFCQTRASDANGLLRLFA